MIRSHMRKPPWLKVRLPREETYRDVRRLLRTAGLSTVCEEALCPNRAECFQSGTATFLLLGDVCSRNCRYCNVKHGDPSPPEETEPERVAEAARKLGLRYVVVTSVTRDDLEDGGAAHFARTIASLRRQDPARPVEVLIPDFQGSPRAIETVARAVPDVVNHNLEVVESLFPLLRAGGDYRRSLELLETMKKKYGLVTKSGIMVGLGEREDELEDLFDDLAAVGCDRLTIGQYQQPSRKHWPVRKYYHPDAFARLRDRALEKGLRHVQAGPLVRSSYRAADMAGDGRNEP